MLFKKTKLIDFERVTDRGRDEGRDKEMLQALVHSQMARQKPEASSR